MHLLSKKIKELLIKREVSKKKKETHFDFFFFFKFWDDEALKSLVWKRSCQVTL